MSVMPLRSNALLVDVEATRERADLELDQANRSSLGQFMTPEVVASFMASMFGDLGPDIRLLDAGAGVGSLTAAFVNEAISRPANPRSIEVTAYEVDRVMLAGLRAVFGSCESAARAKNTRFTGRIISRDFVEAGTLLLDPGMFEEAPTPRFNAAILNPPYRKIAGDSRERLQLRGVGLETSNLYTAFVGLAIRMLEHGGELVAITPRSFCNGPYFRSFRRLLLEETSILRVHVFESRDRAFRDNSVLQENIIFHLRKGAPRGKVVLTINAAPGEPVAGRSVPHSVVVDPKDPNAFIHLATSNEDADVAVRMESLPCRLEELGINVSTGRVVDFRAREFLRGEPGVDTAPLIYPTHFHRGFVSWPKPGGRKANAIADEEMTRPLMVPNETYVLTKRFTSKEEKRRVVAAVCEPSRLPVGVARLGIENHVNYFHAAGKGLSGALARGIAAYLNSSLVDRYFRQFNGHTQVNATDLRSLRYPDAGTLRAMGKVIGDSFPDQSAIDAIVDNAIAAMA